MEFIHLNLQSFSMMANQQPDTVIIRDYPGMHISSVLKSITPNTSKRYFQAEGRKTLMRAVFYQNDSTRAYSSDTVLSAMWLKLAAYELSKGLLQLAGHRPMPAHELAQLRELPKEKAWVSAGIDIALEIIGVERASRPVIARSIAALSELLSAAYDRELVMAKANTLLEKQMIADCYYYVGRNVSAALLSRKDDESFFSKYTKLIQIALDLSNDNTFAKRQQVGLFKAATAALRAD